MCDLGRSQLHGSLMKAALMDQQKMASLRVNSGSQRFRQYPRELSGEYSNNDLDNKDTFKSVDMGKS